MGPSGLSHKLEFDNETQLDWPGRASVCGGRVKYKLIKYAACAPQLFPPRWPFVCRQCHAHSHLIISLSSQALHSRLLSGYVMHAWVVISRLGTVKLECKKTQKL